MDSFYEIDENFLTETGRTFLSGAEKEKFLEEVQDEFECRVGEQISAFLTPEQLDEYEALMDGNLSVIRKWIGVSYENNPVYQTLREQFGGQELLDEYANANWLLKNCPQYSFIIYQVYQQLVLDYSIQGEL